VKFPGVVARFFPLIRIRYDFFFDKIPHSFAQQIVLFAKVFLIGGSAVFLHVYSISFPA
jgi:hypothetical protein